MYEMTIDSESKNTYCSDFYKHVLLKKDNCMLVRYFSAIALLSLIIIENSSADVLCKEKSGVVFNRDSCKKNESQVNSSVSTEIKEGSPCSKSFSKFVNTGVLVKHTFTKEVVAGKTDYYQCEGATPGQWVFSDNMFESKTSNSFGQWALKYDENRSKTPVNFKLMEKIYPAELNKDAISTT